MELKQLETKLDWLNIDDIKCKDNFTIIKRCDKYYIQDKSDWIYCNNGYTEKQFMEYMTFVLNELNNLKNNHKC